MIIEPTVGRVVWYRPNAYDLNEGGMQSGDSDQPFSGEVVYVHGTNRVNLVVTDHVGQRFIRNQCHLRQDDPDSPIPEEGEPWAEWMPYQIGQAKKHAEDK